MALNLPSIKEYTGDGSTTDFVVPPHLEQDDISVYLDGVLKATPADYTFTTAGDEIRFGTAPASGVLVRTQRSSDLDTRAVDFQDGSVLTEKDLDDSNIQVFYAAQEAIDKTEETMRVAADSKFDAQNKVIKDVANPTNDNDAVNKTYLENTWLSASDKAQLNAINLPNLNTVANSVTDVNTVADDIANVNTVSTNVSNVNTVAGSIANVNTVAARDADVGTVASRDADIGTVADRDAAIGTVADRDADIGTVATDLTGGDTIGTVAGSIADVNTVAGSIANVNTVAARDTDVGTVATDIADVRTVATNVADVNTVAGNTANVTTVAGNNANVTTVAGISSDVTTVATNNTNVSTVATNITDVNSVATNISGLNTIVSNMAEILAADDEAEAAALSAQQAAASAASAATILDNFDDRYLGQKASDPSVDNDGDALVQGALYFNTTEREMRVYDSANWISASSASIETMNKFAFTATAGQTVFSGVDDNGLSLALTSGVEFVFLNGILLEPTTDYSTTSSAITLVAGANLNDELNVIAFGNFTISDAVSAANGGTFSNSISVTGSVTATSFVGDGSGLTGVASDPNSTSKGLYEHANTISANYAITSGNNAMTAGPITIDSGVTVTVPTGSVWTVV